MVYKRTIHILTTNDCVVYRLGEARTEPRSSGKNPEEDKIGLSRAKIMSLRGKEAWSSGGAALVYIVFFYAIWYSRVRF